jgi:hypothetical protein
MEELEMRKFSLIMVLVFLLSAILTACAAGGSDGPERAAEGYLNALVAGNGDKIATLSCADWETNAMLELDSFQAVEARLQDLKCEQSGSDGDITLVTCQGQIITSYDGEDTPIDLNTRSYEMTQSAGEWLVCGYR